MKVLLWNVKWGKDDGCSTFVNRLASSEPFDLICLTESTTRFLEGWDRKAISMVSMRFRWGLRP